MSENFRDLPWLLLLAYGSKLSHAAINEILTVWCLQHGRPLHEFFAASDDEWEQVLSLPEKTIKKLEQAREKIIEYIQLTDLLARNAVQLLTITDERYPQQLKAAFCSRALLAGIACGQGEQEGSKRGASEENKMPPLLCYMGDVNILHMKTVAVIGARRASETSLNFARTVARFFAERGINIVSGNAAGVDTAAFEGAMNVQGYATIVLPQGILTLTNEQRAVLLPAVKAGKALVLSQFHPQALWQVYRAMERNKVVTGLAEIVVVAESNTTGGTWNGATGALEQRRPLYVQKNADISHAGNAMLLQWGAIPVPWPVDNLAEVLPLL